MADAYRLQLWSLVVPKGHRIEGLTVLDPELEKELSSSTKLLVSTVGPEAE